jgi:hypothetical protein
MCQIRESEVKREKVTCYRVYVEEPGLGLRTIWSEVPPPDIGVQITADPIKARRSGYHCDVPYFYAVKTLKDLRLLVKIFKSWKWDCASFKFHYFKCELAENIKSGIWQSGSRETSTVFTYTGKKLTLIKEIQI